jgi:hypothetical protein
MCGGIERGEKGMREGGRRGRGCEKGRREGMCGSRRGTYLTVQVCIEQQQSHGDTMNFI